MNLALIIIVYVLVIVLGFLPVVKKKQPGEIFVYSFLLILSAAAFVFKLFLTPQMQSFDNIITDLLESITK